MISTENDLILAIDTASLCSSVALTYGSRTGGKVLGCLSLSSSVTHSRRLLSAIDWLLAEAAVDKESIRGIAVGLGPGSFTGLRIGMATAKGLVAASGVPLYGVPTIDAVAACCTTERLICSVLDARKKEVYTAFYRCNDSGLVERTGEIYALSPEKLADQIQEPVLMTGDGLVPYGNYFRSALGEKLIMTPAHLHSPSAAAVGLLAGEMHRDGRNLDVAQAVPLYVRVSDAELNLLKNH